MPSNIKDEYVFVVQKVKLIDNQYEDMIKFYNKIYLTKLKEYLKKQVKTEQQYLRSPLVHHISLQSPLRESLPTHLGFMSPMSN